jgi:hypothetical protein
LLCNNDCDKRRENQQSSSFLLLAIYRSIFRGIGTSPLNATLSKRVYTISVTNPAAPPPTRPAPGKPEDHHPLTGPTFYITGRQSLSPGAILLAIVAAVGALSLVLYALSHTRAAGQKDDDDPNQVDTVVVGDPTDAPVPARPGTHVSTVHPTIIVRLPRWGPQVGFIPNTPAGQLLYNWLAAFNQADYSALANALPNVALASATAAQMELRRQTGGFLLLSAKEVLPGVLVFRLRAQNPPPAEVLGTLQVRPNSNPATIASFSLRAVPSPRQDPTTRAAPLAQP